MVSNLILEVDKRVGYVVGYVVLEACENDLCASSLREISLTNYINERGNICFYKQKIRTLCKHCNFVFSFFVYYKQIRLIYILKNLFDIVNYNMWLGEINIFLLCFTMLSHEHKQEWSTMQGY